MTSRQPLAHLIHGFLGAGKTTLAKRLETELGAVRYSPDEWMVKLYGLDPPAERFATYLARVYELINAQWPIILSRGVDVILDFGFWTRAERDAARRRAADVNAVTSLYWVCCAEETARVRCRARNQDPQGSLYIADATFEALKERFVPLEPDEGFVLVDTEYQE